MPFITKERRNLMLLGSIPEPTPGDLCYVHYQMMVQAWKAQPRWTTAHNIYKDMCWDVNYNYAQDDNSIAYQLAWQVFFQLYVMPYELEKRAENGDIA